MVNIPKKVSAGFYIDLNMLFARYSSSNTIRFTDFARCFRETQFSLIFCGRKDPREQRLLMDEMISMILKFWAPTTTFQDKVFGLYMLYAVYIMQPLKPKVKLRLKPSHWDVLMQLLDLGTKEEHLDLGYIIQRLYLEKCFLYSASLREMGPVMTTEREEDTDPNMEVSAKVFSSMEMFSTDGTLEQISHVHDEYVAKKASQQSSDEVKELTMVSANSFSDMSREISLLQAKYRAIQEGAAKSQEEAEDTSEEEDADDIGVRRTKLRRKLFRSTGTTRLKQRHDKLLQGNSDGNLVIDASGTDPQESSKPGTKRTGARRKKARASTSGGAESMQSGGESDCN